MPADHEARPPQRRVWASLPAEAEPVLRVTLPPTDLQTLMLDVARSRAQAVTPARLVQRWRHDRFVRPAAADPRLLAEVENRLWSLLPERFAGVVLSPVAPLGTTAALGTLDQNRVISTVRGTEVVSDPTNPLAVEAAVRRSADRRMVGRVDLAAAHRVIRGQVFDGPGQFAHFALFALVSSGRDRGSGRTEAEMIVDHLRFYAAAVATIAPSAAVELTVSTFRRNAVDERLDELLPEVARIAPNVTVLPDTARTHARGYYTSHALGIGALHDGQLADLGDGGLTDWTSRLLADAKERCLTSAISIERLAVLAG